MWEALAAIGSIASAVVIALTVVLGTRQLVQLRRAHQFEATRTVLLELVEPAFIDAYRFVWLELTDKLADNAFRHELGRIGLVDEKVHKEIILLRAFERIGTYVRNGLVDGNVVYPLYAPRVVSSWELLAPIIAVYREVGGIPFFENFEYLYQDCRRWLSKRGWKMDLADLRVRVADYESRYPVQAARPQVP